MIKITNFTVDDVRFPTSKDLTGSDAIHTDPDYSATYVTVYTSDDNLKGFGLAFTIGQDAETGWKDNMDMIPEGSVIYAKWNDDINKIKVAEGVDSDASKFIRFVLGAMVMHSGIVMFF